MPGPPPKPASQRRRRNAAPGTLELPAEGYRGDAPDFPLRDESNLEAAAWADLWRTPQAAAWARLGWVRTVARYCRIMVQAEGAEASAAVMAEARQLEDRLGLSPMAMLRLRWEIVADELGEARAGREVQRPRSRPRAVDPVEAARGG